MVSVPFSSSVLQLSLINKLIKKDSTTQLLFTPCNTRPLITERSAKKGKAARFEITDSHKKVCIVVWPGSPSPAVSDLQILHHSSEGMKQQERGSHFFTGRPSE